MGRDLLQMCGHGLEVAPGQDEPGALALLRADRSENVSPFGAPIMGRRRAAAASSPTPRDLVLLADAGFVLPPDFYAEAARQTRFDPVQLGRETLSLHRRCVLRVMARAGRQLARPQRLQVPAHRGLAQGEAELVEEPLCQVLEPPTHDPMDGRDGGGSTSSLGRWSTPDSWSRRRRGQSALHRDLATAR